MSMNESISKAIKENLPAQVSEELQAHLKEADTAIKENTVLKRQLNSITENFEILRAKDIDYSALKNEKAIFKREKFEQEIKMKDMEITYLKDKYTDVRSLMHDVFRNKTLSYSTQKNESIERPGTNGYNETMNNSKTTNTTVTEE